VYRDNLSKGIEEQCRWIFLNGEFETILLRMQKRAGHFMPETLLHSQFKILEIPLHTIVVDISKTTDEIVDQIILKI
jgi:gluconokinase